MKLIVRSLSNLATNPCVELCSASQRATSRLLIYHPSGLQTRVRLPLDLLLRRQHLRSLLHHRDHILLPSLRRWLSLRRLVLAHLRRGLHVYCLFGC
jgi:hypothetical protein